MTLNLCFYIPNIGNQNVKFFSPPQKLNFSTFTSRFNFASLGGKTLFLTGGTGFFGRRLLALIAYLNTVDINLNIKLISRNPSRFLANYPSYTNVPWLTFISGDIRNFNWTKDSFDLLIHAAADTTPAYQSDGWRIFDDLVLGTRHVLDCASATGVRRALLVSSGAVYGPQPLDCERVPESAQWACDPLSPGSAYAEGKRAMELLGALATRDGGPACVMARCFAFVGPGLPLDGHFAIGNFIRDALERPRIEVAGDGRAVRSYLYVADLAVWLITLLLHGEPGTAYNVGSDQAIDISTLAHRVRDLLAPSKPILIQGQPDASPRSRYVPDISRARALGLEPWTDLDAAILATAARARN